MLNLITDRTLADYLRWKTLRDKGWANMTEEERTEWAGDMKGAYNASDLNRVGSALNYLRDRLTAAGYLSGEEFTAKTDWSVKDVPTGADLTYYLKCVSVIRGVLSVRVGNHPGNASRCRRIGLSGRKRHRAYFV